MTSKQELSFANKTILVAEDDDINRMILGQILKSTQAKIIFAIDGKQAFQAASKTNFDVVLMDIQMPVMSGIEALRAIRVVKPEQIIIAVTANVLPEDKHLYDIEGFDGLVEKPVDMSVLLETIEKCMLLSRAD